VGGNVARLRKIPSPRRDATRGLEEKCGVDRTLSTRRGYALLCMTLVTLENERRQTTLQQVARKTEVAVRVDPALVDAGFGFDPKLLAHRRELVAVMRQLERLQVIKRIDRDDKDFVSGDGDCLYRIDRAVLSSLLGSLHGASTVESDEPLELIEALNYVEPPESKDAYNRFQQHRLVRRLLDDPAMYFDELTPAEYEYFNSQGERLIHEICKATGLVAERRAEGVALLDAEGSLTDVALPELGTRGHSTLLIAEWLCRQGEQPVVHSPLVGPLIAYAEIERHARGLATKHAKHWRKGSDSPDGAGRIAADAVAMLRTLGLIEVRREGVLPRPAIARYRVAEREEVRG
ncbi:MAG: TIGR02678 family protein, partial [Planctomycetota bacterium]